MPESTRDMKCSGVYSGDLYDWYAFPNELINGRIPRYLKLADLDAPIADLVVVILKQDVSLFRQAEIFGIRVLAAGDQGVVNVCASFVFHDFESIEPVLYCPIGSGNDTAMVPLAYVERDVPGIHIPVGRNEVV